MISYSEADIIKSYLINNHIDRLYHFTDRSNLLSIIKNGGLYSWYSCDRHNIHIRKPGGDSSSRSLDSFKGYEDYVRLSFCHHHPMMYTAKKEGRISEPYNSFGNGAGMRVSPCGYMARTLDEALDLAKQSAEVSHNHPEGIKGAQAIAAAIFLARQHTPKGEIRRYIEKVFGYDLQRTCDDIRPTYEFDVTCQGSCPEAIIAFLDSTDYESHQVSSERTGGGLQMSDPSKLFKNILLLLPTPSETGR